MGFMDDYGLDKSAIIAPGRAIAKEGRYLFEIGDAVVRKGTKNKPKDVFLLITYQLTDGDDNPAPAAEERFWMKRDGRYDDTCKQSMGYLDFFLKRAGFEGGVSDPEFTPDALVGLRGKLRIEQNKVGDRTYANAKEVEFLERDDDEANEFADDEPAEAPVKATRTRKAAAESPVADSPWEDD